MRALTLALACCALQALQSLPAAAEYMYRPGPMHGLPLGPHHGPPHGPHKHHPHYVSGKAPGGGPGKRHPSPHGPVHGPPPPPHYHGRPHHRPRKPAPALGSSPNHWKTTTPYKTTKDPFRAHGSEPDFGSQAALVSALKASSVAPSSVAQVPQQVPLHGGLHTYTNIISDDRGPIHTIPAPNLSPADKPGHLSGYTAALEQHAQHALQRQAIQSALNQLTAAKLSSSPPGPPLISVLPAQGYQVSEPQTASQEGVPQLYAPDPDPSRPAPKLKPTTDPHSLPSEGRGPHFSIDPQFGAVSTQHMSSLSPQDLFHLLNGFPLQQEVQQPHIQIMHHGLTGDTLSGEHQHLILQQQQQQLQHLQQQHLQQQLQLQVQAGHSLQHVQPADFQPHYESFDFDEQSYQKSLFPGLDQDHEVSEDAPRPSIQRPDPISSAAPQSTTSSAPPRGDLRSEDGDEDQEAAVEDYAEVADESPVEKYRGSSTTLADTVATPAPQTATSLQSDLYQHVHEEPDSSPGPGRPGRPGRPELLFRRQPNSVHIPDSKLAARLPYGTRIRPKRIAVE